MPAQAAAAPLAVPARQVDFPDNAPANQAGAVRLHHLAHEFVAGRAAEAVVAALQFEIGIADARHQQPDQRKAFGTCGNGIVRVATVPFSRWTASMPL